VVVGLAVRFALSLKERLVAEFLLTVRAGEVLGMPGLTKRSHNLTNNGLITAGTGPLLCGVAHIVITFARLPQQVDV